MSTAVLVSTFAPFSTLSLSIPSDTRVSELPLLLAAREPRLPLHQLRLSHASSVLDPDARISQYGSLVNLRLAPLLRGGKGGFGSQLRAAGGRMSSRKTDNTDSCRDLTGRRLRTIKEAQKLAAYMESEPERKKAQAEAKKAKLEQLERQLGIDKDGNEVEANAGQKRRFDDTKFLEETQELVEGVRDALAAGLLKKRKKAKTEAAAADAESSSMAAVTKAVVESSTVAPIVALASIAVGATTA